jgi:8-oxo-dGTP diphosphatase
MTVVRVAVGVILDAGRNILITRRAADAHQGDLWEFPGGKVEDGETVLQALQRELHEELGIDLGRTSELLDVRHDYGDKAVRLEVYMVWDFSGEAKPLEGQPMQWVPIGELRRYAFPAANELIIEAVENVRFLDA